MHCQREARQILAPQGEPQQRVTLLRRPTRRADIAAIDGSPSRMRSIARESRGGVKVQRKPPEGYYSRDSASMPILVSPAAFLSLYFFTHAAKLLPAAVSRPVKASAATSL